MWSFRGFLARQKPAGFCAFSFSSIIINQTSVTIKRKMGMLQEINSTFFFVTYDPSSRPL
jgi:hypothetical protein